MLLSKNMALKGMSPIYFGPSFIFYIHNFLIGFFFFLVCQTIFTILWQHYENLVARMPHSGCDSLTPCWNNQRQTSSCPLFVFSIRFLGNFSILAPILLSLIKFQILMIIFSHISKAKKISWFLFRTFLLLFLASYASRYIFKGKNNSFVKFTMSVPNLFNVYFLQVFIWLILVGFVSYI